MEGEMVVENASYPDLMHRRAVFFVEKKFFVIIDDDESQPEGSVRIIGKPIIGASHIELEIVTDGIPKRIRYDL